MSINKYFAGQSVPGNERYAYIIGKDGFYILKRNSVFEACVLIESIPDISEQAETFLLKARKIPYELIKQVLGFFFAVYQKHKSEAMVLLGYEKDNWSVYVPEQEVSSGSVKYKNNGHSVVGSIHSHPGFSCAASGIDEKDETDFDGLHLIISRFEDICPEIACYVVINGRRFEIEPDKIIDQLPQPEQTIPEDWLNQVNPQQGLFFKTDDVLSTTKENIETGKEPVRTNEQVPEIEDEWPCERCLHEDVCCQDVMELNGTCQFYEFDSRKAIYRQQDKEQSEVIV